VRVVSVLSVAEPSVWAEIAAHVDLEGHVGEALSPTRRVALPSFELEILGKLQERGVAVLERSARQAPELVSRARERADREVAALPADARRVLRSAQRHALDGVVRGLHAWDPVHDEPAVRALFQAGVIRPASPDEPPYVGAYRLADDLPEPPETPYDFDDAIMGETEDLGPARPGPVRLLHDVAAVAAALWRKPASRTHQGTLARNDARRIGRSLGVDEIARDGAIEAHPRWGMALRAIEALGAASFDPITREVFVDLGLETALRGDAASAADRLIHRLVERDLHVVVPAVRAAIRQAGGGAIDEVIFLELCAAQHRDLLFPAWSRPEGVVYPHLPGERLRAYDDAGWERVEAPMVGAVLRRLERLGVLRRAPGVFAGTEEGRAWAGVEDRPVPPIWVGSDLEVVVPPESLTPGERYDVERLCVALGRDVVDRYRLDRASLRLWLGAHDVDEAIGLLTRRSPGVPSGVVDALRGWAAAEERVVLTRGVLLDA